MNNYTVIIKAEDKTAMMLAITDADGNTPDLFNRGLSATGQAPATHFVSAGCFYEPEYETMINGSVPYQISSDNPFDFIQSCGLKFVEEV